MEKNKFVRDFITRKVAMEEALAAAKKAGNDATDQFVDWLTSETKTLNERDIEAVINCEDEHMDGEDKMAILASYSSGQFGGKPGVMVINVHVASDGSTNEAGEQDDGEQPEQADKPSTIEDFPRLLNLMSLANIIAEDTKVFDEDAATDVELVPLIHGAEEDLHKLLKTFGMM